MKKSIKGVLVLDGTPRVGIAICRSLHAHGIPAVFAQVGHRGASLGSKCVVADVALPNADPAFFEDLKGLLSRYELDTIVPCTDVALRLIAPRYDELSRRAHLTCPEPLILRRVLDKSETLRIASECGIAIPVTYTIRDLHTLHAIEAELQFPVIAKPLNAGTTSPFKIKYFQTFGELESFVRDSGAAGNVFQEFLPGEGVGVAGIMDGETPLVLFQHRRIHEWPARGGVGVLSESQTLEPQLEGMARTLLRRLEWRGPAMVEFRREPQSGKLALMEVNGRFWGSLPLAMAAGLDLPYFEWQMIHGAHPDVPATYKTGLKMRWTTGELRRLEELMSDSEVRQALSCRRFTPVLEFARALDPRVRSALFSPHDPRPAIQEVSQYFVALGVRISWAQIKKLLPRSWRQRLIQLRYLERKNRKTYLARWLMRSIGLRGFPSAGFLRDVGSITFVCRGNRIRSPLAAAILTSRLIGNGRAFQITSAGTSVVRNGAFDARAKTIADSIGLDFDGHSQSVTADLVENSDLLVVMDFIVEAEVVTQFPQAAPKVVLLSEICGTHPEDAEIPDPDKFPDGEFSRCMSQLIANVESLADRLAALSS